METFYFEIILYLEKSYKDGAESPYTPFTQLPLTLLYLPFPQVGFKNEVSFPDYSVSSLTPY